MGSMTKIKEQDEDGGERRRRRSKTKTKDQDEDGGERRI